MDREVENARNDLAMAKMAFSSNFWKIYEKFLDDCYKKYQRTIETEVELNRLYRSQGAIEALRSVSLLPGKVMEELNKKMGSA